MHAEEYRRIAEASIAASRAVNLQLAAEECGDTSVAGRWHSEHVRLRQLCGDLCDTLDTGEYLSTIPDLPAELRGGG